MFGSRRAGDNGHREDGFTILEVVVSMSIFLVVLAVFLAGMVSMTRGTSRAQTTADAGDALRIAFQNMDQQIRYSSSINYPGAGTSGAVYVEFITTAQPDGQAPLCTQWRYDPSAGSLGYRTVRDAAGATPSAWRDVAFDIRNELSGPSAVKPFILKPAGGAQLRQSLEVKMLAAVENGGVPADTSTVFVARNSSGSSPSNSDLDHDGRSDSPVCMSRLGRP